VGKGFLEIKIKLQKVIKCTIVIRKHHIRARAQTADAMQLEAKGVGTARHLNGKFEKRLSTACLNALKKKKSFSAVVELHIQLG